jgi:hypothetical protein
MDIVSSNHVEHVALLSRTLPNKGNRRRRKKNTKSSSLYLKRKTSHKNQSRHNRDMYVMQNRKRKKNTIAQLFSQIL